MDKIQNYTILKILSETGNSKVYRARWNDDDRLYIIKKLIKKSSSQVDTARFRQEYEIIRSIDYDGIIKVFDCLDLEHGIALVLEDFDGITLKSVIRSATFTLKTFIVMAIKLAETVGHIHMKNIVHKDIKPHNILVNLENDIVKLSDFGISQVLTHENDEIYNPDVIEGTLVYMSPEQTGRMNRSVDYRSDLYSLGVTFYEMLTGDVPFKFKDPMEVIHAHIALKPMAPMERDQSIPAVLSDIIMKLMMKNAEDRYQNAFGLAADLEECLQQYERTGAVEAFELATRDVSIKFNIPQKFFGREKEIDLIMKLFERVSVSGKCEIILVSGNPGIGKSALINEIHKPIVNKRGYFISGKYDQFRKDVPYSAIIQAFAGLTRQLLIESHERISTWKDALLAGLGPNGKVITDIIPAIELIIGKQPDIPILGPDESNNRFMLVFKNFIRVFASSAHPIVVFLDDLQWADFGSLTLMKNTMTDPEIKYVFFIGSYRDNEVNAAHPLMHALSEITNEEFSPHMIELAPLDVASVNHLISNFLRSSESATLQIAELVHKKTSGNPFFINQFLKALYDEGILYLIPVEQLRNTTGNRGGWTWDIEKILSMRVTDNVVDLMAERISRLPGNAREILKTASCVGNWFDIETLSLIQNKSVEDTLSDLMIAVTEGLIIPKGQAYIFYHDRIQEAAYSLISDENKAEMHNRIGRLLLRETDGENLHEKILYIVNHLNAGMSVISSAGDLYDLAKLNLQAGIKAKASAAYQSALNYIKIGIELVNHQGGNSGWKNYYDVSLSLYSEASEAAYLCTEYDEMSTYADAVLLNARNIFDKTHVFEIKIHTYRAQARLYDAVMTGLDILNQLGERFPKNPGMLDILKDLMKTKLYLYGRKIEEFENLPLIRNDYVLAKIRILSAVASAAYWSIPNLLPLVVFRMLKLSIKHGNSMYSPYNYSGFGIILCSIGQIEDGYRFGKLALSLMDKMNFIEQKSKTLFVVSCFVSHWKDHLNESLIQLQTAYKSGLETGDMEFAAFSSQIYCYHSFEVGKNLEFLEQEIQKYIYAISQIKQGPQLVITQLHLQMVENMLGKTDDPCMLRGSSYDENIMLQHHIDSGEKTALFTLYYYKMILNYLFQRYTDAFYYSDKAESEISAVTASAIIPRFYYFNSLLNLAVYNESSKKDKKRMIRKVNSNLKKLNKWASHAPMNQLHKYELVQAEIARVHGDVAGAMELYKKAIKNARKNEYLNDEAIACELASGFYYNLGFDEIALAYMKEAYGAYSRWGALAKLRELEKQYPDIIIKTEKEQVSVSSDMSSLTTSSGSTSAKLDISTVIKASQTLSSEIDLGKLVKNIMTFSIQNAGAEKGFLILENEEDHNLTIEAYGSPDKAIEVLGGHPLDDAAGLSLSVVNYVYKTKDDVLLGNACEEGMFTNDVYISKNKSKSILCTPITHKGKIAGILYLENNISANAFIPERLELLRILSSQAAISIENARLLMHRENEVKLITEMKIAANIQTALIPENPAINGYDICGYIKPAEEVGGDYYDIINCGDIDWAFIGDVSGHGVNAGLVMMMVQTSILLALKINPMITPSDLLSTINMAISSNISKLEDYKYMTLTAFAVHQNGKIIFSGLHQNLLVYRSAENKVEIIPTDGLWLGFDFDMGRDISNKQIVLNTNDVLLLYTDGVTEGINDDGNFFGEKNLVRVLEAYGASKTEIIKNEILDAIKGYVIRDDITLLIIRKI